MRDLIARIEAATGPDREIDMGILTMLGHAYLGGPPRYSDSLDAALSLVPEGASFNLARELRGRAWAAVYVPGVTTNALSACTPALALCAAALRARLAMQEAGDASA